MKRNRIVALFLALAMMLSMAASAAGTIPMDVEAKTAEDVKAAAEAVLSASAMNMWMYEDNDVTKGTIEELATPARLADSLSALGVNAEEIAAYTEDISFFQEKTEYFKTMREEQDIRRNDFQLHYFFDEPVISGNRASLYVVESISFHYPELPDKLSEAVNYYNLELVRVNGKWLVAGISAENDDFDGAYKGTGFTAANAEECFRAVEEKVEALSVEEIAEEYGFTLETEAEANAANVIFYDYNPDNATAYAYTYVSGMYGSMDISDPVAGRAFYNPNFKYYGGGDCQNFASQCVWAGFNGSNSKDQIYDPKTDTYSPIMDCGGSFTWRGIIPGYSVYSPAWTITNGDKGFAAYVENEMNSSSPDMIALTGTIPEKGNFASVYDQLRGAVLHVNGSKDENGIPTPFGHAVVVTDVLGPERSQIYYCGHTSDRKNLALTDRGYRTCAIKYIIPQQMKIRSAPEVKITANLLRPEPVGSSVTVGGTTDQGCHSLSMDVTGPDGLPVDDFEYTSDVGTGKKTFVRGELYLASEGLYTITITAKKAENSAPVVYVYTVRAYQ